MAGHHRPAAPRRRGGPVAFRSVSIPRTGRSALLTGRGDLAGDAEPDKDKGFVPQPIRWRAEQTNGTLMLHRRLVRDYESLPASSESRVHWAETDRLLTLLDERESALDARSDVLRAGIAELTEELTELVSRPSSPSPHSWRSRLPSRRRTCRPTPTTPRSSPPSPRPTDHCGRATCANASASATCPGRSKACAPRPSASWRAAWSTNPNQDSSPRRGHGPTRTSPTSRPDPHQSAKRTSLREMPS